MRAFAVAVLATLGGAKLFDELDLAFMNYIAQHSKNYASLEEFNLRFENFAKFDAEIKHFNSVQSDSVHGHNALSDWTAEERQALNGYRDEYEAKTEYPETMLGIPTADIAIDWTQVVFNMLTIHGIYGREMYETWYKMTVMLQSGLDISPVITHRLHYTEFAKGFEAMKSGQSGKVILNWNH